MSPRDRQIYLAAKSGKSPTDLATEHKLTVNRVHQIIRVEGYREKYASQQQAS